MQEYIILDNGVAIPSLCTGIHHIDEGALAIESIEEGIKHNWRAVETASSFYNERSLGLGIKRAIDSKVINREDICISTKLHDTMQGYENCKIAFNDSLEKIGVDYIDIFQVRYPLPVHYNPENGRDWQTALIDTWRAMEELYREGKIKVIGVSNCAIKYLDFLMEKAEIKPMINQIEIHPKYQQKDIQKYCRENNIIVSSWASLQYGKICYDETIINIAKKYNKTPAQIVLRWHLQHNHFTCTRTTKAERLIENLDLYNFNIVEQDIHIIDNMDGQAKATWPVCGIDK